MILNEFFLNPHPVICAAVRDHGWIELRVMIEEVILNSIDLAASRQVNWSNDVEHIINVVFTDVVPEGS